VSITALTAKSMTLPVALNNLDAYIQYANSIASLSADEELVLAKRLREHEDLEAARNLILPHLRFVVNVSRGYLGYGLPLNDLIQEGNIGLMKAVKRFDPDRGSRLVSFAVHWIRAEIHEFILRNWRIVKVATTKAQRKLFFNLRSAKKRLGWLGWNETEALAADLEVDPKVVVEMEQRLSGHDVSFDPQPDSSVDDNQSGISPNNYLADYGNDPIQLVEQDNWEQRAYSGLEDALRSLDPRSRDILQRRWLTEDKSTLHELALQHGVSAERVRQIESSALRKLKNHMVENWSDAAV
jgi:RNA polymerase sigma-32 factor